MRQEHAGRLISYTSLGLHAPSLLIPPPLLHLAIATEWAERCLGLDVSAREASVDLDIAIADDPLLLVDVPVAEITPHEWELHSLALTRLQIYLLESTKDLSTLR